MAQKDLTPMHHAKVVLAAIDAPVEVFVSILPQKYFVERIGGERVVVSVMVGPGQRFATYEPMPKPEQSAPLFPHRCRFRRCLDGSDPQ